MIVIHHQNRFRLFDGALVKINRPIFPKEEENVT